jgi:hypothetical protein
MAGISQVKVDVLFDFYDESGNVLLVISGIYNT